MRSSGGQSPGQSQSSQYRPNPQQGSAGAGNEPGNRRGRRRRGRERPGPGGGSGNSGGASSERELQGGGQESQYQGELVPVKGLLDLRDEGYGFLRSDGYLPSPRDVYISISQARRFALRKGDYVEGASRPGRLEREVPRPHPHRHHCAASPPTRRVTVPASRT